ncbi:alpha-N-arabinofuranosidase [Chitinophaga agri]|uniref:non-reducing end alpha-L-arabinofuranosidase n=1 Tax=Chitinophaga agri TaxID=2703787 RepID=A0A6B9ZN55_9BACT|nr:alpha-L-arabinofuranosidase C-terminal domain-containing protein [Chitinophaga agri]QHS63718.1 hypothetical protein GWR21_30295 [Chitinophaga agri]
MNVQVTRRNFIGLIGVSGLGLALKGSAFAAARSISRSVPLNASIEIDFLHPEGAIDDGIYGQFIEHLGRAVNGGIYEEGSPLSDANGIRKDVLEKIRGLRPSILRYPGGTFTKIYRWMDGVGPRSERRSRPNLIWGGVEDNHFGTDEAVAYARLLNTDTYFAVNMGTGTAEEAGNWVEYCNGTQDTYYANMRRKNGHADPFKVKYWGIGNEEAAGPDIGRLQDVKEFVKEAWLYTKAIKLQDKDAKLVLCGADDAWNDHVLKEMGPVCDYISMHHYVSSDKTKPASLFPQVDNMEQLILTLKRQIQTHTTEKVTDFSKWYRFPHRANGVKISIDELGIWEPGGTGAYQLEEYYTWEHALGTATFFNIMIRQASIVGMATWAQTVNVLAPIMTSKTASVCQTIYYPMQFYRRHAGNISLKAAVTTPDLQVPGSKDAKALDVAVTMHEADGSLVIFAVNRHPELAIKADLRSIDTKYTPVTAYELNAAGIDAVNTLDNPAKNVVTETEKQLRGPFTSYTFPAHSVTAIRFKNVSHK